MATETVPMDDAALFAGATTDETAVPAEVTQEAATEQPAEQTSEAPARDEHGRFAAKVEPEVKVEAKPEHDNATIPAWRAGEIAAERRAAVERAEAAERRAQDIEHRFNQVSGQLRQLTEKPAEEIDPYMDPAKFRDQGVRQAIDPIAQRMNAQRDFMSEQFATQQFGQDTVKTAYQELGAAMRAGNRDALATYERMQNSMHPFGDMVAWHKRESALKTVGDDPNAWFEKEFARRAAADPQFAAKFQAAQQQPSEAEPTNIVKLPPSLAKASGSAGNAALGTLSNEDLYSFATR